jgi:hypothetical protein
VTPTAYARLILAAVHLCAVLAPAGVAHAGGRVPTPEVRIEAGTEACIAPPDEMRRNHMDMLRHQRDKTLRLGERGAQVSLNGCVSCHASRSTGSVNAGPQDFCETCHAYAAVKLDCFECHQAKSASRPMAAAAGVIR